MDHNRARFASLIRRFADRKVLVLGDMVVDEYVIGKPTRISREAPVLILQYSATYVLPGGATNTAYNLRTLGAHTTVVGITGDDEPGQSLRGKLDNLGIDTSCLLVDPDRSTSIKTRILGKGTQEVQQQIVRIDRVDDRPLAPALRDRMIDHARRCLNTVDSLLISDYELGVISQEVIDACLPVARERGLVVTVDAHGGLHRFRGITAATPNQPEAEGSVGRVARTDAELDSIGESLLHDMEAGGILITRGSEGVALYERGQQPYHLPVAIPNHAVVIDPNGAGDTVAAVFSLAVASEASMRDAAYLSNIAGGEVVRRIGAATLTANELQTAVNLSTLEPPSGTLTDSS